MPRSAHSSSSDRVLLKRRWSSDDARAVLTRLDASVLSVREFCEAEGVDPQRLYRWRAQLGATAGPAFVEIGRPAVAGAIEIVLRSGHVVRVSDGFSEETLRRVVAIFGAEAATC